jgi:hypothetical protein
MLVVFALLLVAPTASAQKPGLVDVPGRRAESRRGRGYRPETLVRALRMSYHRGQIAPAKAAAIPTLQSAQQKLADGAGTMRRGDLGTILNKTPYSIGEYYGYADFRKDVPHRYVEKDTGWRIKVVENPKAVPRWKEYVAQSIVDAKAAKKLAARRPLVETALTDHMDKRFVAGRSKWKKALATADETQLFDAARTMILRVNDLAHSKTIPQEQVGSGSSHSSHSHKTLFTSSSASSSSYFRLNQLVPNAATYTFNVADGAKLSRRSMIPHEARAVVEMGVQIQDIQRELQRRKSDYASPLSQWVNNTRLAFNGAKRQDRYGYDMTTRVEVRMDRVGVEALGLQSLGVLSPRMKQMLQFEKAQTARQTASSPNPLLGL